MQESLDPEKVAYWYFRLNGYFQIENFVVHPPGRGGQRTDADPRDLEAETCEQRLVRHRAGALALIGAALEDRGREDGSEVVVRLAAWFVGDALNAADDHNLI